MYGVRGAVLGLVFAAGCLSPLELPNAPFNVKPFADAGIGTSHRVLKTISLDATASFDPDGNVVAYRWWMSGRAPGSMAEIIDSNRRIATFTPDVIGTYTFTLEVEDDLGDTDRSQVTYIASPPTVTVEAGSDIAVPWLANVQLAGSLTVEPGFSATYEWKLVSRPARSEVVLATSTTLSPSFVADTDGTYVFTLTARTPFNTVTDAVTVTSTAQRIPLGYSIVATEYSKSLDRLVIASDSPPRVHIVDPVSGADTAVTLSAPPLALALQPGGRRAAVGHDQMVSIVNVQTGVLEGTYAVPFRVRILAFAPDNRVHFFEIASFNAEPIRTLTPATGSVVAGELLNPGYLRILPAANFMYLLDGGSNSTMMRFDLAAPTMAHDHLQITGQNNSGPLFIADDGSALITAAGYVFRTSSDPDVDMTSRGNIGTHLSYLGSADQSAAAGKIAATAVEFNVSNPVGSHLLINDATSLANLRTIVVPEVGGGAEGYAAFTTFRADGTKIYVLAKAASTGAIFTVTP